MTGLKSWKIQDTGSSGRDVSGVIQNGRRGLVRHVGRLRFRALNEATKSGMRAEIWACVVRGRWGGRYRLGEEGWDGRRVRLRTVHQIGMVDERASGIPRFRLDMLYEVLGVYLRLPRRVESTIIILFRVSLSPKPPISQSSNIPIVPLHHIHQM